MTLTADGDGVEQAVRRHTSATLTTCTLTGVISGDVVTCSGTATFDTPHVGTGKTVTVTGLTFSGATAGNYTLSSTTATTLASITGAVDTTAPTAPSGLTATAAGATQINLTWTAATDNVGRDGVSGGALRGDGLHDVCAGADAERDQRE